MSDLLCLTVSRQEKAGVVRIEIDAEDNLTETLLLYPLTEEEAEAFSRGDNALPMDEQIAAAQLAAYAPAKSQQIWSDFDVRPALNARTHWPRTVTCRSENASSNAPLTPRRPR